MPNLGYYDKLPRPDSVNFFKKAISGHSRIRSMTQLENQLFEITKINDKKLLVHLTNIYIVGEAEVYEIMSNHPNIKLDSIVTISSWNQCSSDGKYAAEQHKIGLFIMSDFLGALNFDGKRFIDYISPAERERIRQEQSKLR